MRPSYCFPLSPQNHLKNCEPKRRCSLIQHRAAWLPLSLDRDLRGIWGFGGAASGQRPYPDSVVLALGSSWIQNLPYAPTPMGMKSSLFERQMVLDPPLLTCVESFPFIWSPSCIIPAINYSLEIALFRIFFHYDYYVVFFYQISSSDLKTLPDKFSFPSSTFSNPITYVHIHLFIHCLWVGTLHVQGKDIKNMAQRKGWKESCKAFLLGFSAFWEKFFFIFFHGFWPVVVCNNHFEVNTPWRARLEKSPRHDKALVIL